MECTHENRYDFGRQCSDCNQWLGPEKVIEKTWEIKEQELREQIAKDVIAFLQNTEWYDDAQVIEIIKGK